MDPQQQTRCCKFAAVNPAARRFGSVAKAAANAGSAMLSAYVGSCMHAYCIKFADNSRHVSACYSYYFGSSDCVLIVNVCIG